MCGALPAPTKFIVNNNTGESDYACILNSGNCEILSTISTATQPMSSHTIHYMSCI